MVLILASFISCDDDSAEIDSVFYQMSEFDSIRSSQKLREFLKREALAYQDEELAIKNGGTCWYPWPRKKRDVFRIRNHGNGIDSIDFHGASTNIIESVVDFYLKHRDFNVMGLTDTSKIIKTSINPFYNQYTHGELKEMIEERQEDYDEMKSIDGADPALIEYYLEKVESVQLKLDVMNMCKADTLYNIAEMTRIEIDCPDSIEYTRILNEAIEGVYHLRNYECMRYFREKYLNLFLRTHRLKRQIDKDKLEALEFLHPVRIIEYKHTLSWTLPPE